MLRPNVKNYAESGNIRGLHYIFRDALDADPTFEDYLESYRYCENIPGFFEKHREMTPFEGRDSWRNSAYWNQLKMDLSENFSRERYEHLREVAQVYYAEKIRTIRQEEEIERQKKELEEHNRQVAREQQKKTAEIKQKQKNLAEENHQTVQSENVWQKNNASTNIRASVNAQESSKKTKSPADIQQSQDEEIERQKKELEEHNRQVTRKQQEKTAEIKQKQKNLAEENHRTRQGVSSQKGDSGSKKWIGVAVAVVIVILAVVLLLQGNPGKTAAIMTQPGMRGNVLWQMLLGRQGMQ